MSEENDILLLDSFIRKLLTYVSKIWAREPTFSIINFMKFKYRSNMLNENLMSGLTGTVSAR